MDNYILLVVLGQLDSSQNNYRIYKIMMKKKYEVWRFYIFDMILILKIMFLSCCNDPWPMKVMIYRTWSHSHTYIQKIQATGSGPVCNTNCTTNDSNSLKIDLLLQHTWNGRYLVLLLQLVTLKNNSYYYYFNDYLRGVEYFQVCCLCTTHVLQLFTEITDRVLECLLTLSSLHT